jgi:hypothetical protein
VADVEKRASVTPAPLEWEYAPAPEARDIVSFEQRYGLFIGGEHVDPRSGSYFPTVSPATEERLAEVALAGPEDVGLAVEAARDAFENGWSEIRPSERAKYLFRIARILSRATSTCRWQPRISSTTPAGRTSSNTRSRTAGRGRSASPGRSSRGTFHS